MKNMGENRNKRADLGALGTLIEKRKDGSFREILDDWRWIFTYTKRHKFAVLFYTVLGVLSTTMGIVASVAGKYLIDIIVGYQTSKLGLLIAIILGSAASSLIFSNLISRLSAKISIDINNDIQADIFDRIIDVDWKAISEYSSGDLLNRFNSDVSTVSKNAISWLPSIIISIYNFAATFAVIWHYNKIMSLIAFASAPVMLVMSRYFIRKQREYAKKVKETGSRMMGFEVETFYNFDTIKSFGVMNVFGKKLRDWQHKMKDISLEYNLFTIKTNVFMSVLGLLVQYGAFGYCLFLLWTQQITYGTMTLFLAQRARLSNAFNSLIGIVPSFLTSSVSAHRIREIIDLPRERHLAESSKLVELADGGFEVRMDGVSFAYVEDKQVIVDSAFKAAPGEIVAIIGPSGEGKTTMIRLLLGLIRPDSGVTFLRANEGTEVQMNADSRLMFSYVPQGNTMLYGTVAENMRLVKENATDEEIINALKVACAWDFISKLPDTINSKVGERGKGFSEGQAQRLAIARAVLRDAPILLLDEATSALDVATEREVLRNIIGEHPNKTCIVTTHRPTVLSLCKRVYRVMEGKVTELDEEESAKAAMDF
ncbi:MAG: ABC transporter ATP-binding protein/permease [Clostridiales bacterium]|nr:ABC transporter ATP-binding protein/permease [Clostridiales bacterium]